MPSHALAHSRCDRLCAAQPKTDAASCTRCCCDRSNWLHPGLRKRCPCPTDFLPNALIAASPQCHALACRNEAFRNPHRVTAACAPHAHAVRTALELDDRALKLGSLAQTSGAPFLLAGLDPYFRRLRDAALMRGCQRSRRLALLLSGHARTFLQQQQQVEWRALLETLRTRVGGGVSISVFAYLDLRTEATRRKRLSDSYNGSSTIDRRAVERAFAAWSPLLERPAELEVHREGHPLLPRLETACEGARMQQRQFLKVAAATRMMERAEQEASPFDLVLRTRPDICPATVAEPLAFALSTTNCTSVLSYDVHDAFALYPRYAADAFANLWRAAPWCAQQRPPEWSLKAGGCNVDDGLDGGDPSGSSLWYYALTRAGVAVAPLHKTSIGRKVRLRRPSTGCVAFS